MIGLTMAVMQGGYVRRLPEHKIKPTAVLVSTLLTACSATGAFSSIMYENVTFPVFLPGA